MGPSLSCKGAGTLLGRVLAVFPVLILITRCLLPVLARLECPTISNPHQLRHIAHSARLDTRPLSSAMRAAVLTVRFKVRPSVLSAKGFSMPRHHLGHWPSGGSRGIFRTPSSDLFASSCILLSCYHGFTSFSRPHHGACLSITHRRFLHHLDWQRCSVRAALAHSNRRKYPLQQLPGAYAAF